MASSYHTLLIRSPRPLEHFDRALRQLVEGPEVTVGLRALTDGDAEDLEYVFGFRAQISGLLVCSSSSGARAVLAGVLRLVRDHRDARIVALSGQGTLLDFEGGRVCLRSVGPIPFERLWAGAPA